MGERDGVRYSVGLVDGVRDSEGRAEMVRDRLTEGERETDRAREPETVVDRVTEGDRDLDGVCEPEPVPDLVMLGDMLVEREPVNEGETDDEADKLLLAVRDTLAVAEPTLETVAVGDALLLVLRVMLALREPLADCERDLLGVEETDDVRENETLADAVRVAVKLGERDLVGDIVGDGVLVTESPAVGDTEDVGDTDGVTEELVLAENVIDAVREGLTGERVTLPVRVPEAVMLPLTDFDRVKLRVREALALPRNLGVGGKERGGGGGAMQSAP